MLPATNLRGFREPMLWICDHRSKSFLDPPWSPAGHDSRIRADCARNRPCVPAPFLAFMPVRRGDSRLYCDLTQPENPSAVTLLTGARRNHGRTCEPVVPGGQSFDASRFFDRRCVGHARDPSKHASLAGADGSAAKANGFGRRKWGRESASGSAADSLPSGRLAGSRVESRAINCNAAKRRQTAQEFLVRYVGVVASSDGKPWS